MLRTSLALSSILEKPVRIRNIRARRPNPGLAPQHLVSVEAVAAMSDARVDGLALGSTDIVFRPGELLGGAHEFDIGTAGSVSLILQTCLLPAALSNGGASITVHGGTDVRWAPPIDYMSMVHFPMARRFGVDCSLETVSRGFYPEGGGEVRMEVAPTGGLSGAVIDERGDVEEVRGIAYARNLPDHVITRMKHAAIKRLLGFENVRIDSDAGGGTSTGAGIVLAARCGNCVIGSSALGERGRRAEELGETCASDLMETVDSGATIDDHMVDQVLVYMAVAGGRSVVLAEELTPHARTNMDVIERFLGKVFSVSETEDGLQRITAH